ncbi:MAG: hypothetical protein EPO08_20645 [Rhodospirillaceae bacterium]|nr:MAG: hypothetical protein EPO08_20645 [Rhodospirillaceae bacterium]
MANNNKHNIDNFFAFLDDVLTPDTANVEARQQTKQSKEVTKQVESVNQNNAGAVLNKALDTTGHAFEATVGAAAGLGGKALDTAGALGGKAIDFAGSPTGAAAIGGIATAVGGPTGGLIGSIVSGLGKPATATPSPLPPPPAPAPPSEDKTGMYILGSLGLLGLGYAITSKK